MVTAARSILWSLQRVLILIVSLALVSCGSSKVSTAVGGGLAYFKAQPANEGAASDDSFGVALESRTSYQVADMFSINGTLTWGLTAWSRAGDLIDASSSIAGGTTEAYRCVHAWANEGSDGAQGLKGFAAIFAYMFMWTGYMAAFVGYLMVPFAPSTYGEVDATGSFHFGDPLGVQGYVEGGGGVALFGLPETNDIGVGGGPVVGLGIRIRPVEIGARFMWVPAGANGLTDRADVFMTSFVVRFVTGGAPEPEGPTLSPEEPAPIDPAPLDPLTPSTTSPSTTSSETPSSSTTTPPTPDAPRPGNTGP